MRIVSVVEKILSANRPSAPDPRAGAQALGLQRLYGPAAKLFEGDDLACGIPGLPERPAIGGLLRCPRLATNKPTRAP